jgi:hypothetical protein
MFAGVIGASGSGGPIITVRQAWSGLQFNTSTTSVRAFTSQPLPGNLLIAMSATATAGIPITITDDFGDGVAWQPVSDPCIRTTLQERLYWKVVGTPVGTGKTVTQTKTTGAVGALFITEFSTDRAATWSIDGTPVLASNVTAANPTPGNITTTASTTVVIGVVERSGGAPTPATGYTGYTNAGIPWFSPSLYVEHLIATTAGTQTPSWTATSAQYSALGAAFKAL